MTTTKSPHHRSVVLIRILRKIHRTIAIFLFVFFLIISVTGLLLGWKKKAGILPPAAKGVSADLKTWLPFDSLHTIAVNTLRDSVSPGISPDLDRIDARPQKGTVKFVFSDRYWEIQVDGTTGKVLRIHKRTSDIIENIHDGTILDVIFNTKNENSKLSYTTIMGLSLLMLTLSGFWLWYGPKRLRRKKKKRDMEE
ncbi:MAG: PepSY domain-containing protein [Chitinophagaceae bacterium]|nr:PepSY domain-containing protein [Chitinophagaceae bacterium]